MGYIIPDDVRHYILDRSVKDNEIEMDLFFSDEEIAKAMHHAARDYNSIPPLVNQVNANQLCDSTNMFFDGIAKHLYIMQVSKLQRNEIEYNAGGVTSNLYGARIKSFTGMIQFHGESFAQAVKDHKIAINIRNAFRCY